MRPLRLRHLVAIASGVVAVGGLAAAGAVVGFGLHSSSAPVAATNLYTVPGTCGGCPAGTHIDSVELQARTGSILLILRGAWPASVDALTTGVCLTADDLRVVLTPHGSGGLFEVSVRKGQPAAALPPSSVAAGLQGGALLIDLPPPAQPAVPTHLVVTLCRAGADSQRVPASGDLLWTGHGGPAPESAVAGPPTAAPSTPVPGGVDPTALLRACSAIPSGTVPAYLQMVSSSSGVQVDPRTMVPTEQVTAALTRTAVNAPAAFAFAAVVLPAGATAPISSGPPLDGAGTVQLYAGFDGTKLHKAIRTFSNGAWTTLVDGAANAMTFRLGPAGVSIFWTGFRAGDAYGFVSAGSGGCGALGLDTALTPQLVVK